MINLLSAGLRRLWKNKVLWLTCLVMAGYGAILALKVSAAAPFDAMAFSYTILIGMTSAVFCGLFVGTEYSDGTIRNKIAVGHSRSAVYLSNLLINLAASLVMAAAYLLTLAVLGIARFAPAEAGAGKILSYALAALLMQLSFVSAYTLICMLVTSKAASAVSCLLLAFGLAFASVQISFKLGAYAAQGAELVWKLSSGLPTKAQLYRILYDLLPSCQGTQIAGMNVEELWKLPLYSALLSLAFSTAGVLIFRKKDLK